MKQKGIVFPKMGRQRNNSQLKEKKEAPERVLNEIEASKLSDTEFIEFPYNHYFELNV